MKPTLPQGTRDFGPAVVRKRNYILQTIRSMFELYGFQPLETPAMENLDTLMGKYGEEGDKLIFKILNNGLDNPAKKEQAKTDFEQILDGKNVKSLTERALRYDLTIPFARYVAMNHGLLTFPFKRFQIQPVWRADRPQKGRYREFYQCDADVVGSRSLLNEVELSTLYHEVFNKLGLNEYELRINSRKILSALAEKCGGPDKLTDITVAIDKLDKIGIEKVREELAGRGLEKSQIDVIDSYLSIGGSNQQKLEAISTMLGDTKDGNAGIKELSFITGTLKQISNGRQVNLVIDFTLARGLNYYTGVIFEVKAPQKVKMGSIGGGGRYDDLTGLFGVPDIAGVGISFGVDRIYDVMEELNLFPTSVVTGTTLLFFNLGEAESLAAMQLSQKMRDSGIATEVFHENSKFDKQFKYAEKKAIPFIAIVGTNELEKKTCLVKQLATGNQQEIEWNRLGDYMHDQTRS